MSLTEKLRELAETADATNKGREPLVSLLICVRLLDVQSMIGEAERLESQNRRLRDLVREAYMESWGELAPNEYREEFWETSAAKAALDAMAKEGADASQGH